LWLRLLSSFAPERSCDVDVVDVVENPWSLAKPLAAWAGTGMPFWAIGSWGCAAGEACHVDDVRPSTFALSKPFSLASD
jgi:hypothetical protein